MDEETERPELKPGEQHRDADGTYRSMSEDGQVELVMTPDPGWTRGDQLQLLRLLFGPRPERG